MQTTDLRELIEKIIVPLAGALIVLALTLARDFTGHARRSRHMEEAKQRLDFWITVKNNPVWVADPEPDREILRTIEFARNIYSEPRVSSYSKEGYIEYRSRLPKFRQELFFHSVPSALQDTQNRYFLRIFLLVPLLVLFVWSRWHWDGATTAALFGGILGELIAVGSGLKILAREEVAYRHDKHFKGAP